MTDELEIESEFYRIAQTDLAPDEAKDFSAELDAPEETPVDDAVDAEGALPTVDTDMEEMNAIKELVPWDSFGIIFDPHYAQVLTETLGLPPAKAKAKSFYIYFSPENKRLEGVVNKRYVGGYGTKEELGEDFSFIKKLSPEGFAPDWKEKLLTNIDELPAVQNESTREKLREAGDEEEKSEDIAETDNGQAKDNTVKFPANKPEPSQTIAPQPVGNVDTNQLPLAAKRNEVFMRRQSRMKEINNLTKGGLK